VSSGLFKEQLENFLQCNLWRIRMTMLESEIEREARTSNQQSRVVGASSETSYRSISRSTAGPYFEPGDIVAAGLASFMMLSPLAANALGWAS
jgi:hypothetical protein